MSETWFIGDTHLGHANILEYEREARPFNSLTEMHEAIINRWNAVVHKYDKVYHLGDFAFGRHNIELAAELNGQKRLILGNHDSYPMVDYLKHFKSIHGTLFWHNYILTHVPVHPQQLEGRSDFNIHGHLHSKRVQWYKDDEGILMCDKRYINVSCEQNNLTPINAEEILKWTT
jgi:calcineurin-like phosphoesterase family protein